MLLPLGFIMQPLIVGVTPIGRKYELRLAEIAWRTLPNPRTKNPFPTRTTIIYSPGPEDRPMNENGRREHPRVSTTILLSPSLYPSRFFLGQQPSHRRVSPVTRQKLNAAAGTGRERGGEATAKLLRRFERTPNDPSPAIVADATVRPSIFSISAGTFLFDGPFRPRNQSPFIPFQPSTSDFFNHLDPVPWHLRKWAFVTLTNPRECTNFVSFSRRFFGN